MTISQRNEEIGTGIIRNAIRAGYSYKQEGHLHILAPCSQSLIEAGKLGFSLNENRDWSVWTGSTFEAMDLTPQF